MGDPHAWCSPGASRAATARLALSCAGAQGPGEPSKQMAPRGACLQADLEDCCGALQAQRLPRPVTRARIPGGGAEQTRKLLPI